MIRRKVATAVRGGMAAGATVQSGAERGWPLALARAARDTLALALDAGEARVQRLSLAELLDLPAERSLIAVLEGPQEGLGVLVVSAPLLSGLIEAQTIGRVSTLPPLPRRPTRTDAAMVAGFIDSAMEAFEAVLQTDDDLIWADGFRYASFLDDPRPLGLLLEDVTYRVLSTEVSLADGARTGGLSLVLPAEGRGRRPARPPELQPPPPDTGFADQLGEQVMGAECSLQAVLARVRLPLAAVLSLAPGEVLRLGPVAIDRITLEGLDGRPVAGGKLGQHRGMRALRLTAAPAEAAPAGAATLAPGGGDAEAMPDAAEAPRRTGTG